MLSAGSGLKSDEPEFALDVGATYAGPNPLRPDFVLPEPEHRPEFCDSPFVMYGGSHRVAVTTGTPLGQLYDPYFNRTPDHFYGHQHSPAQKQASEFPAAVQTAQTTYLAHPVFTAYRELGAVTLKDYVDNIIGSILGDEASADVNLPSTARFVMRHQPGERRYVLHFLHATPVLKGNTILGPLETIEDLPPLVDIEAKVKLPVEVKRAYLAPQEKTLDFAIHGKQVEVSVDRVECHQMVVLEY